jgi:hypothetical protein
MNSHKNARLTFARRLEAGCEAPQSRSARPIEFAKGLAVTAPSALRTSVGQVFYAALARLLCEPSPTA